MSKSNVVRYEIRKAPLSKLHLVEGFNLRSDAANKQIPELTEQMRREGQLTPILVAPRPGTDDEYDILDGERRYHALSAIGPKGALVEIKVKLDGSPRDHVMLNWAANFGREDVKIADQARRLYEMENGTYPGAPTNEDGTPKEEACIARKDLAAEAGKTVTYIGNLIRAWGKLSDKCRKAWRQYDIPTDTVVEWAALKTDEEQEAAFESWKAARDANKAKSDGKTKKRKSSKSDEKEGPVYELRKKSEVVKIYESFKEKLHGEDAKAFPKEQFLRMEGKIEALEFMLGKRKRLQAG